jgi:hypothetical protein
MIHIDHSWSIPQEEEEDTQQQQLQQEQEEEDSPLSDLTHSPPEQQPPTPPQQPQPQPQSDDKVVTILELNAELLKVSMHFQQSGILLSDSKFQQYV